MPAATSAPLALRCRGCGRRRLQTAAAWRCPDCRGLFDLADFTPVPPPLAELSGRPATLWRYAEVLPLTVHPDISMGEGLTPLLGVPDRPGVGVKTDHVMPTGSFKDRGAAVLVTAAARLGVTRLIADSSGNAGIAIAAYAARAGIACRVYLPATTSTRKVAQLRALGAEVRQVPGSREDAAQAAMLAADRPAEGEGDGFYASHVYQPLFLHGTKTFGYELWEQLGGRLPARIVLPVGNGTLVLGVHLALRELLAAGRIDRLPSIVAVQAAGCAPLARAWQHGALDPAAPLPPAGPGTIAEGIAIARPARGAQILAAVRDTGGTVVSVTDEQVRAAHADLARRGFFVEPTSAVCWAALAAGLVPPPSGPARGSAGPDGSAVPEIVLPLCGTGLKAEPPDPAPPSGWTLTDR